MSRATVWTQYIACILVGLTGAWYFVLKYVVEAADEWAVVNHPWQPVMQQLHVLTAPLLVFAMGLLWSSHVVPRWQMGGNGLRIGAGLALLFVPMAASGYLLQVSVDEMWRTFWTWTHIGSSGLWLFGYGIHVGVAKRQRQQRLASGSPITI